MPNTKSRKADAKDAMKARFVEAHKDHTLLGSVVCWHPAAGPHAHAAVVDALTLSGLDTGVARELLPKQAFHRACKSLTEERVIDSVNETKEDIVFQFTKRFIEGREWKYAKECVLSLDKTLGKVRCDANPDLEAHAQRELDRCMEGRTAGDVSRMVQKLFEAEADLFPVRDQGGVYFVPQDYAGFLTKVEDFLGRLGGRVSRFPVPSGMGGDRSVGDAVGAGLAALIQEHHAAVAQFDMKSRHDTLDRQADRIKTARLKVEAYAHFLGERQKELVAAADRAELALAARIEELTKGRAENPVLPTQGGGNRAFIFTHSVAGVLRWMGGAGWSFKEARKVVALKVGEGQISDATVRAQLLGGRNGLRGEAAKLTPEQEAELTHYRDSE